MTSPGDIGRRHGRRLSIVMADLVIRDAVWCPSRLRFAQSANVLSGETRRRTASDVTRRRSAARRTPGRPHARQGRRPPRLRLRRPPPPRASPTPPSLRISTHEQAASPNRDAESWGRLCRPMNGTGGAPASVHRVRGVAGQAGRSCPEVPSSTARPWRRRPVRSPCDEPIVVAGRAVARGHQAGGIGVELGILRSSGGRAGSGCRAATPASGATAREH